MGTLAGSGGGDEADADRYKHFPFEISRRAGDGGQLASVVARDPLLSF